MLWYIEREVRLGNNKTCTSKKQQWHIPPKKQLKIHAPDLLSNIEIKKPRVEKIIQQQDKKSNASRGNYDARQVEHRITEPLQPSEIDQLATLTNGNCGLVMLLRKPSNSVENLTQMVGEFIEVSSSVHVDIPKTIKEIASNNKNCSFSKFTELLQVSKEQQEFVQTLTSKQSDSSEWFLHREDRITASIFKDCVMKINENLEVINPTKCRTVISKVCRYYPNISSKATNWGINNESAARSIYSQSMKNMHKEFTIKESGFFIDTKYSFLGASPDGLVECLCHTPGLLEIKCPFTYRDMTTHDYSLQPNSCLQKVDNKISLKHDHSYFYQVQLQMYVVGRFWCDIFICTTKDSFCERINYDERFVEICIQKACVLYEKVILPEIFSRDLFSTLNSENVVKEVVKTLIDDICELEFNVSIDSDSDIDIDFIVH